VRNGAGVKARLRRLDGRQSLGVEGQLPLSLIDLVHLDRLGRRDVERLEPRRVVAVRVDAAPELPAWSKAV
jgi:hypothetical protein